MYNFSIATENCLSNSSLDLVLKVLHDKDSFHDNSYSLIKSHFVSSDYLIFMLKHKVGKYLGTSRLALIRPASFRFSPQESP